jgi:ribosomal protein S18 acetylase RimI-like enzyme
VTTIRRARGDDLDALYDICLRTGDSGGDASALYADPSILGDIYAAPYAALEPDLALVAEDEAGVAAYIVGTADTRGFEARCESQWWPGRRALYPDPRDSGASPKAWSLDQWRALQIHRPSLIPDAIVAAAPAHLHINLLPRLQGRGVGRALMDAWLTAVAARGAGGAHLGCSAANGRALRFYDAYGFCRLEVEGHAETVWMVFDLGPSASGAQGS